MLTKSTAKKISIVVLELLTLGIAGFAFNRSLQYAYEGLTKEKPELPMKVGIIFTYFLICLTVVRTIYFS